jgi:hypothetical protein
MSGVHHREPTSMPTRQKVLADLLEAKRRKDRRRGVTTSAIEKFRSAARVNGAVPGNGAGSTSTSKAGKLAALLATPATRSRSDGAVPKGKLAVPHRRHGR